MRLKPGFRALFTHARAPRALDSPARRAGPSGRVCRGEMLRSAESQGAHTAYSLPELGNSFPYGAEARRGVSEFRSLDKLVSRNKSKVVCSRAAAPRCLSIHPARSFWRTGGDRWADLGETRTRVPFFLHKTRNCSLQCENFFQKGGWNCTASCSVPRLPRIRSTCETQRGTSAGLRSCRAKVRDSGDIPGDGSRRRRRDRPIYMCSVVNGRML